MTHDNQYANPPQVPSDMLAKHQAIWHNFTRGMFWNAVVTAAILVFLLMITKVF